MTEQLVEKSPNDWSYDEYGAWRGRAIAQLDAIGMDTEDILDAFYKYESLVQSGDMKISGIVKLFDTTIQKHTKGE